MSNQLLARVASALRRPSADDRVIVDGLVVCPRNGFADGDFDWPEEDYSFELNLGFLDVQPGETVRVSCYVAGPGDWTGRQVVGIGQPQGRTVAVAA